jgi:hypothetical protein
MRAATVDAPVQRLGKSLSGSGDPCSAPSMALGAGRWLRRCGCAAARDARRDPGRDEGKLVELASKGAEIALSRKNNRRRLTAVYARTQ